MTLYCNKIKNNLRTTKDNRGQPGVVFDDWVVLSCPNHLKSCPEIIAFFEFTELYVLRCHSFHYEPFLSIIYNLGCPGCPGCPQKHPCSSENGTERNNYTFLLTK